MDDFKSKLDEAHSTQITDLCKEYIATNNLSENEISKIFDLAENELVKFDDIGKDDSTSLIRTALIQTDFKWSPKYTSVNHYWLNTWYIEKTDSPELKRKLCMALDSVTKMEWLSEWITPNPLHLDVLNDQPLIAELLEDAMSYNWKDTLLDNGEEIYLHVMPLCEGLICLHNSDPQTSIKIKKSIMPFMTYIDLNKDYKNLLYKWAEDLYGPNYETVIETARSLGLLESPSYWNACMKTDSAVTSSLPDISL